MKLCSKVIKIFIKDCNSNESQIKQLNNVYLNQKQIILYLDQNQNFKHLNEILLTKNLFGNSVVEKSANSAEKNPKSKEKSNDDGKALNYIKRKMKSLFKKTPKVDKEILEDDLKEVKKDPNNLFQDELNMNSFKVNLMSIYTIRFYILFKGLKLIIDHNWSILDLINKFKENYNQDLLDQNQIVINFEFVFLKEWLVSPKSWDEEEISTAINEFKEDDFNFEEKQFFSYYSKNILANKALYSIKRTSPYLYLISLFQLCCKDFESIFGYESSINEKVLENQKVTSLITKQSKNLHSITSCSFPEWCREYSEHFTFLSSFDSRYLLFKFTSFDMLRSILFFSQLSKVSAKEIQIDLKQIQSKLKRVKIKVDRNRILECAEKISEEFNHFDGFLEYDFLNEVGTGLGPTLEFYSLLSKSVNEIVNLWYPTSDGSLFPLPIHKDSNTTGIKIFTLIGYTIARGLYDDRLLDFNLNSLFWDLVLARVKLINLASLNIKSFQSR